MSAHTIASKAALPFVALALSIPTVAAASTGRGETSDHVVVACTPGPPLAPREHVGTAAANIDGNCRITATDGSLLVGYEVRKVGTGEILRKVVFAQLTHTFVVRLEMGEELWVTVERRDGLIERVGPF
jgi:hypothetical protein